MWIWRYGHEFRSSHQTITSSMSVFTNQELQDQLNAKVAALNGAITSSKSWQAECCNLSKELDTVRGEILTLTKENKGHEAAQDLEIVQIRQEVAVLHNQIRMTQIENRDSRDELRATQIELRAMFDNFKMEHMERFRGNNEHGGQFNSGTQAHQHQQQQQQQQPHRQQHPQQPQHPRGPNRRQWGIVQKQQSPASFNTYRHISTCRNITRIWVSSSLSFDIYFSRPNCLLRLLGVTLEPPWESSIDGSCLVVDTSISIANLIALWKVAAANLGI